MYPNAPSKDQRWGRNVVPGAKVTSRGRHGAGQPIVTGIVRTIEGPTVTIETPDGNRRRSISNVRAI